VLKSNDDEDVPNSPRLQQSELLVKHGLPQVLAIDIGQALWTIADRAQSASTTGCENYRMPNAVGVAAGSPESPELSHDRVEGHWTPRNEFVKRLDAQPNQIISDTVAELLRGARRTSAVRYSSSYCFVLLTPRSGCHHRALKQLRLSPIGSITARRTDAELGGAVTPGG
jgi:hypothetical protein